MHHRRFLAAVAAVLVTVAAAPPSAHAFWPANGTALCTAVGLQQEATLVPDGAGGAIVVWMDRRSGTQHDVYAQHVLASGAVDPAWPADGRALCTAANEQAAATPVSDGAGGAIVTWWDFRTGTSMDIYAQHVLASGVVDPAWPLDGRALCTAPNGQLASSIVADGAGGAIVAWHDYRTLMDADVYAQHVLASGAVDPAWPADGRAVCTLALDQTSPLVVADGAGGAIVTWRDGRNGTDTDLYAHHLLASGALDATWPLDGRALCIVAGEQVFATAVSDGASGEIVAWQDDRSGTSHDIYAQHVLASGALDGAWPANGRALCTAPGDQDAPVVIADGLGGGIAAWVDRRSGTSYDIYAARVLASGAVDPAWPANGRDLCSAANDQLSPALTSDGAGGALATWYDRRSGTQYDIYAQHVSSAGAVDLAWALNGGFVCAAANDQTLPGLVTDGAGGAIVAWQDLRGGASFDIYAQRITAQGTTDVPRLPLVHGLSLARPTPNPARHDATIRFGLPRESSVRLELYDLDGRQVRVLASGRWPAGEHAVSWDGRDARGHAVASGLFLVRLATEDGTLTQKLIEAR